ncbi:MAG: hypothetical protein Q4E24_09705 [bacterium]|nr:hypothetical protein [bacterium]
MEIRKLEIDFDEKILKINGQDFTENPVLVTLPGPERWPLAMVVNSGLLDKNLEGCIELTVSFTVNAPVEDDSDI